jgi:hypothetical protein
VRHGDHLVPGTRLGARPALAEGDRLWPVPFDANACGHGGDGIRVANVSRIKEWLTVRVYG